MSAYVEKLSEFNTTELTSVDDWGYIITTYDDNTKIEYFETKNNEQNIKETTLIPSCCDIQICEKIIEMRKSFNRTL